MVEASSSTPVEPHPIDPVASEPLGRRLRRRLRYFSDDLMIAAVVIVVLVIFMLPSIIVTIPAGHLGVLWLRFGGGTVLTGVMSEGTRLIYPWDKVFIYDARLQSVNREFEVLSSDGLKLKVDVAWRYRVIPNMLGRLHQYVGPDYPETLLAQSVGARARDVIAIYRPEDIYTDHRLSIQNQVTESVRYDLKHRFNMADQSSTNWVMIEDVLIKRILLPQGVQEAIVRKNMARHEVEEYALIVDRERQETERKRVEALGIRNFQEIVSSGMTESYLRWRGIEASLELARSHNAKVVIMGNSKTGGLPLISIGDEAPKLNAPTKSAALGNAVGDDKAADGGLPNRVAPMGAEVSKLKRSEKPGSHPKLGFRSETSSDTTQAKPREQDGIVVP